MKLDFIQSSAVPVVTGRPRQRRVYEYRSLLRSIIHVHRCKRNVRKKLIEFYYRRLFLPKKHNIFEKFSCRFLYVC